MEDREILHPEDPRLALPPELEFLCATHVTLADVSDVHALTIGSRVIMQVEPGGRIQGPRLTGRFLPGSVVIQLARSDHVVEVEGRFLIETDDGHHIFTRSMGVLSASAEIARELAEGQRYDPASLYLRASVAFEAAQDSPYAWLNRGLYIAKSEWAGADAFSTIWRIL